MARIALDNAQRLALLDSADNWIASIKRLDSIAASTKIHRGVQNVSETLGKLGLRNETLPPLILAMEHLDAAIKWLTAGGIRLKGAAAFRSEWEKCSDLRDALEHEEDYIAGQGRFPDRLTTEEWRREGYEDWNPFREGSGGVDSVVIMGVDYHIRPAIRAALALAPAVEIALEAQSRRMARPSAGHP